MTGAEILDSEILAEALHAQSVLGTAAQVEILVKRFPSSRYIQQMQIRHRYGPFGKIISLTPEGTVLRFKAAKLILFLCMQTRKGDMRKKYFIEFLDNFESDEICIQVFQRFECPTLEKAEMEVRKILAKDERNPVRIIIEQHYED